MSLVRCSNVIHPIDRAEMPVSEIHKEIQSLDQSVSYRSARRFLQEHYSSMLLPKRQSFRALPTIRCIIDDSYPTDSSVTVSHILKRLKERNISISASQTGQQEILRNSQTQLCAVSTNIFNVYGVPVQDNAPAHKFLHTTARMKEMKIRLMEWPPISPDINPIELVWESMKSRSSGAISSVKFQQNSRNRRVTRSNSSVLEHTHSRNVQDLYQDTKKTSPHGQEGRQEHL
ncbi:hypothetical protein OSTOST_02141 [Ostertagia ostertagi]